MAKADHGTIIEKSVLSVAAYRDVLRLKGGDVGKFNEAIGAKFPHSTKGSRMPDEEKVPIDQVMLVCQHPNGTDVKYHDSDGFGHPGIMGLWDLHSSDALNQALLVLKSGLVNANFCPLCAFWSTNNEMLNNHVRKHYNMGLTCHGDGFTTTSVSTMKLHMEEKHGYGGKHASQKKKKGKA